MSLRPGIVVWLLAVLKHIRTFLNESNASFGSNTCSPRSVSRQWFLLDHEQGCGEKAKLQFAMSLSQHNRVKAKCKTQRSHHLHTSWCCSQNPWGACRIWQPHSDPGGDRVVTKVWDSAVWSCSECDMLAFEVWNADKQFLVGPGDGCDSANCAIAVPRHLKIGVKCMARALYNVIKVQPDNLLSRCRERNAVVTARYLWQVLMCSIALCDYTRARFQQQVLPFRPF